MAGIGSEVIGFIKKQGGPVTDMDLAEHFDVLDDPDRIFPIFNALNDSLQKGIIVRIPASHPNCGGRLTVRLATDAIA